MDTGFGLREVDGDSAVFTRHIPKQRMFIIVDERIGLAAKLFT